MSTLTPWSYGPFELLLHAEMHLRNGDDFDRRIAMISFDNAIEVAVTTYLSLHPLQRQNRTYNNQDVEQWLQNYHTRLDFLEAEVTARGLAMPCSRADIVWYHDVRNGQYHGKGASIPQARDCTGIRNAALWIFSTLFDVSDLENLLEENVAEATDLLPEKDTVSDRLIDEEFGMVELAGDSRYTSELLYAFDAIAYSELAKVLKERRENEEKENKEAT